MADQHDDWFQSMDSGDATTGVDTAGHGDWFNAMDQDATFGDSPRAAMEDLPKDAGYSNPMVSPGDWNIGTSLAHGGSQGLDMPLNAALLAKREAEVFRRNGADEGFIKSQMPNWYAQAMEGLKRAHQNYRDLSPGTDLATEILGTTVPSVLGTGAVIGAAERGLAAVGLPGLGRVIAGTAGRLAPAASSTQRGARVATQLASRGVNSTAQGALDATQQLALNPDVPAGEQIKTGAGVGAILTPWAALSRRAHVTPEDARAGLIAEARGVPVRAGALAQNPVRRAFSHSVGSHPDTPAALARARDAIENDYHTIGARANIVQPEVLADLRRLRAEEVALDRIGPRLEHAPQGNSLMRFLGRHGGSAAAGLTGGLTIAALEGLPEFLANPKAMAASVALGAAGLGARHLGNTVANRRAYRLLQLRANALGMSPAEYLSIGSAPVAAGNHLMEYSHAQ